MDRGRGQVFTRRQYLTMKAVEAGFNLFVAAEAVASTAIEHPERDYDEERTWEEWERRVFFIDEEEGSGI
jgi:hypothetical protein